MLPTPSLNGHAPTSDPLTPGTRFSVPSPNGPNGPATAGPPSPNGVNGRDGRGRMARATLRHFPVVNFHVCDHGCPRTVAVTVTVCVVSGRSGSFAINPMRFRCNSASAVRSGVDSHTSTARPSASVSRAVTSFTGAVRGNVMVTGDPALRSLLSGMGSGRSPDL